MDYLTAAQAAAENLDPVPSRLLVVKQASNQVEVGYSYGGCRPAPTAVVIGQSSRAITVTLMGPRLPAGQSQCPPNLVVGKTLIQLPSLQGRAVVVDQPSAG